MHVFSNKYEGICIRLEEYTLFLRIRYSNNAPSLTLWGVWCQIEPQNFYQVFASALLPSNKLSKFNCNSLWELGALK
jgi:hypothetical protein